MRQRLLELDTVHTRRLSIAERRGPLRTLAAIFAHSGDSWFWLSGLGIGWAFGPLEWKSRTMALISGVLFTAVLVLLVKFTVRRRRPAGDWGKIYRSTDPHSFPSGHAARAFMLAVMAVGLGPAWLAVLLAAWAPLVTLARVAMGVHYLSDVLAGALFGALMGFVVLRLYMGIF